MMNRRSILRILPAGVVLAALPVSSSRAAVPAVDTIKGFYDTLLSVMQQAKALGIKGRYEKLDPAIHKAFNLPLMTRLSVGPDWQKLSPEEQKSLTEAFSDLSVSTYAARFDGYSGEHFDVDPNPTPTSGGLIVNTKLVESSGEVVVLNYLIKGKGGTSRNRLRRAAIPRRRYVAGCNGPLRSFWPNMRNGNC